MKRLLLGFAACASVSAPTPSASAMPGANPNALTDTDSSIVLVKGGLGHGGGHRGGRGHQYGLTCSMPSSSSGWTAETSSGSTSQQIPRPNGLHVK
jgi:hypothetical protein